MTKTPDETKKGLECCAASYADCHRECPYKPDCDGSQILKDALALIQQLQAENAEQAENIKWMEAERDDLKRTIRQLEAERDAAVDDLENYATLKCFACKYYEMELTEAPCDECKIMGKGNRDMFEWCGVQKEE